MSVAWRIALIFLLITFTLLVSGLIFDVELGTLMATGTLLLVAVGIALSRLFSSADSTMSLEEAGQHLDLPPEEIRALMAERRLQVRWHSGEWQVTRSSVYRIQETPGMLQGIRSRRISHGEDVLRGGRFGGAATIFIALVVRGLAMWIYVPGTILIWSLLLPVRLIRPRPYPTLHLYITVIDQWFVWVLLRTILRPVTRPLPTPKWPRPGDPRPLTRLTDAW